jgi:hypothetical protein
VNWAKTPVTGPPLQIILGFPVPTGERLAAPPTFEVLRNGRVILPVWVSVAEVVAVCLHWIVIDELDPSYPDRPRGDKHGAVSRS